MADTFNEMLERVQAMSPEEQERLTRLMEEAEAAMTPEQRAERAAVVQAMFEKVNGRPQHH